MGYILYSSGSTWPLIGVNWDRYIDALTVRLRFELIIDHKVYVSISNYLDVESEKMHIIVKGK